MTEDDATSEKVLEALFEAEERNDGDLTQAKADIVAWDASLSLRRADEGFSTYVYRLELSNDLIAQMVDEGESLRDIQGMEGKPREALFRSFINSAPDAGTEFRYRTGLETSEDHVGGGEGI